MTTVIVMVKNTRANSRARRDLGYIMASLRPDLTVLLLTGDPSGQGVRRARDAGADAVLGQPVAARELARALADVFDRPDTPG